MGNTLRGLYIGGNIMETKQLLKELSKSRKGLEQYVVESMGKLPFVKSVEEIETWENYNNALDLGVRIEDEDEDEGYCNVWDVLGIKGKELILKRSDEDLDFIDDLEFYPLDMLDFSKLISFSNI